ncbi:MAG TPA: TIGR04282 family arsenosugar biosynthesis glycosyltransferase, partial [Planctomycetota bacterium]|nr:TIGR04282 family arsenosugar biosynthesis glycosyltransferase [Planctomycetota bacterium]
GARMEHAFAQAFDAGARQAIAIGTDCALLGPAEVRESVRLLDAHDIVLGPAKDGGYYLIGLRSRAPELFSGVPWSSERVLEATLERARAHGRDWALLASSRDLDTEADLAPLRAELRERWVAIRSGSDLPFPLRTFRALEWARAEAAAAVNGSGRAGRRIESAQADC